MSNQMLSRKVKQKLIEVAQLIANDQKKVCAEMWKESKDDILKDDPDYTLEKYTQSDWSDNGYEYLDEVSEYLDKKVTEKIKELSK